jgi:hypothetical protein
MLEDFWILNGTFSHKTEPEMEKLLNDPAVPVLESFQYDPPAWPARCRRVAEKTFKNVGLSKTTFKEITFKKCVFEVQHLIRSNFTDVHSRIVIFTKLNFIDVISIPVVFRLMVPTRKRGQT